MEKQKIKIDRNYILNHAQEDYNYLTQYMCADQDGNYNKPGISDYPFYAYYSELVSNTTILEIGTSYGGSAVMLSHNQTNKIISYDVVDRLSLFKYEIDRNNIEFRFGDFREDDINYDEIRLITIDASHQGEPERGMVKYLEDNWKGGLLYLDDIHNNNDGDMTGFWESIDKNRHEVFDISDIAHGHTQGSGLVNFNKYYDLSFI